MSHDLELLMICSHRASCTHFIPFVVQDPDDLNTQGSSEARVAPNHFLHDTTVQEILSSRASFLCPPPT